LTDPIHTRVLRKLRNTRDLRAEILSLAAELSADDQAEGRMLVTDAVIAGTTVRKEWDSLLPALAPEIRPRMALEIKESETLAEKLGESVRLPLDKPNYRFEVLRLLLGASLEDKGSDASIMTRTGDTQIGLMKALGASATPIRGALAALRDAGLIRNLRQPRIDPQTLTQEQLGRLGATPQTLRFRFERGARIKPPAELLARTEPLLGANGPKSWKPFSLSGSPVAQEDVPELDLIGMPRLDLVAHIPRSDREFDADVIRMLDDGLEPEPNMLASAPVVVTLVRAQTRFDREPRVGRIRCAHACDVFLSLLDMRLREQAIQYARAVRR